MKIFKSPIYRNLADSHVIVTDSPKETLNGEGALNVCAKFECITRYAHGLILNKTLRWVPS